MAGDSLRTRVGLLFGGRSGEHEISLRSALSIVDAIDRTRYDVTLIGIDRGGHWRLISEPEFRRLFDTAQPRVPDTGPEIALLSAPTGGVLPAGEVGSARLPHLDVVFPILHGTFGEDGTVQGLLELTDLPYVGAGVLGSAVGMDKDVQKRLAAAAGVPVVPFCTVSHRRWTEQPAEVRGQALTLGFPVFVKPANLGSSVGISKVTTAEDLATAIETAFAYDTKIVIERGVDAREIECAVLGNEAPRASVPGEVRPTAGFYSYAAKYLDKHGAGLDIPAHLSEAEAACVCALALQVFQILECSGLARVDFFLERSTGTLYFNEINTLPGFTTISMYPKLWEASGLPYRELIATLLDLAIERHRERKRLSRAYAVLSAG